MKPTPQIRYNEIDPNAAQWLRNLAADGHIPPGEVDERSIKDLKGADLAGLRQFHTFAGIGGWPLALKLAGWPEDREVWTGSCPCQPYSSAGKQKGNADERDLWPAFFALVKERRPQFIFGEQVASAIKHGWLDRVYTDLEGIGYTVGSAVLGAHSVGANHIRQRLYWGAHLGGVSDDKGVRLQAESDGRRGGERNGAEGNLVTGPDDDDDAGRMAQDPSGLRRRGRDVRRDEGDTGELEPQGEVAGLGLGGGVSDGDENGRSTRSDERGSTQARDDAAESVAGPISRRELVRMADANEAERGESGDAARDESGASHRAPRSGPWSDFAVVLCTDGKARRTGARVFPLAYGLPRGVGDSGAWRKGLARSASRARIGRLKGYGNAIVPELAAEFVRAYMDARGL